MYSTVCETAVEYDNAGNLTRDHRGCRYVYDYENKITRIFIDENANGVHDAGVDANIVEFTYDALGWRIERTNPSGTALRYYYDDQRVVLRTNVDSGGVESDSRSFVFGNYIDEVLMMCPLGLEFYYAHDHLYSPAALFNSSGGIDERYEYDAYGKRSMYSGTWAPRTSSPMGHFYAFTGRELDYLDGGSLQIMYYRARYYDPEAGRFMQRDPLGIDPAGGKENPFDIRNQYSNSMNIYEYGKSKPLSSLDHQGLCHNKANNAKSSMGSWNTGDFVKHYCFGKKPYKKGDSIDLNDVGLLDGFKNAPSVFMATAFYEADAHREVIRTINSFKCNGGSVSIPLQNSDTTVTDVTLDPGLFAVGRSTFFRSYNCNILIKCCGKSRLCFSYSCDFTFSINDWFRDPIDIGIEIPGCTPYPINASWQTNMEGNTCTK